MTDKFIIASCGDIPFDTRPAGALYVQDGVHKLDKAKTFNAARRLLNAGVNTFYVNRFGMTTWYPPVVVDFDWESPGYFDLLREYVQILHQPTQDTTTLKQGAEVIIDLFLGCVETWQYYDYVKSVRLINAFYNALGDLPYVHFAVGRECNAVESRGWVRDCVYPTFKALGIKPYSYGAAGCQPGTPGPMEWQKYQAELAWDEHTALHIYRPVHGVRDETSDYLITAVNNWCVNGNPICVLFSVDGVWDGASETDFIEYNGRIQRRPSVEQIKRSMRFIMANTPQKFMPGTGQVKYGFECMTKAMTIECAEAQIGAVVEVYAETFGEMPANRGQYSLDWVEPKPPEPEPQPEPEKPKWNWSGWWRNNRVVVYASIIAIVVMVVSIILIF